MTTSISTLVARRDTQKAVLQGMLALAERQNRELTAQEQVSFNAGSTELESLSNRVERERFLELAEAKAAVPFGSGARAGAPERHRDAAGGFQAFGEFAMAVLQAGVTRQRDVDRRLVFEAAAPSTGMRESVGADGGYLVPPEFSTDIWRLTVNPLSILPLTANVNVGGNSMSFLKDTSQPWGTDGVQAYWQAELTAGQVSKPRLEQEQMLLEKLLALVPVSEEMMTDAAALGSYLPPLMAEKITWKYEDAFFHAVGAGTPKGFMTSGGLITVTKTAGFTYTVGAALTVADVGFMMSRLTASSYSRAVWHIHQSIMPSLIGLTIGNQPVWTPPNAGFANAPGGYLLGRPILPSEHCKAPLVAGDIVLADWKGYRTITKAAGMETSTSMHLYFDADAVAFKVRFRINGQPILNAPITPANGSDTLGHFVVLDDTR